MVEVCDEAVKFEMSLGLHAVKDYRLGTRLLMT
jgi:hypothetical protein